MNRFKRYLTLRTLKHRAIPYSLWRNVTSKLPLIQLRTNKERARLRLLTTLFLAKKRFSGTHGLIVTNEISMTIAVQACLPILYLGLNSYKGWIEIVVYPGPFLVNHAETDATGITYQNVRGLSGEAWLRGPLILSWQDVYHDSVRIHPGHHVVLHEFAHKLDMLNGRADGLPPLHPDMVLADWSTALTHAWEQLQACLDQRRLSYIDAYAATSPAEFFAVISEYFFTAPMILKHHVPHVFEQLQAYYRQTPPIPKQES